MIISKPITDWRAATIEEAIIDSVCALPCNITAGPVHGPPCVFPA
ncbi:hypothetical protein [Ruegeria sp. Ofav3-42]|nr:hypothetical protein [Ruegeria sp. Ofav3-42]